jgi:hypothetical protein
MSQTVREAVRQANMDSEYDRSNSASTLILRALGIDPDMSVETLQRRLLIAERVLRVADSERSWIEPYSEDESNVIWDWIDRLTREEVSP